MYRQNRPLFLASVSLSLLIVAALFLFSLPRLPLFAAFDLNDGLESFWEFEENTGDKTYSDVAGSKRYTGTLVGNVTWSSDDPVTTTGDYSLEFDGSDPLHNYVQTTQKIPDVYTFTVSLWFKVRPENSGNYVALVRTRTTERNSEGLFLGLGRVLTPDGYYGADDTIFYGVDRPGAICGINTQNTIQFGEWHHLVAVWGAHLAGDTSANPPIDPEQFKIYIDGNLQEETSIEYRCGNISAPVNEDTAGNGLAFGHEFWLGGVIEGFNGFLDDIRIYNRVLSDEEVFELSGRTIDGIEIDGPTLGDVGEPYEFTTSFLPAGSVTIPFTYTWSATDGFREVSDKSQTTITWDSAGTKTVTVTARSDSGLHIVTDTHTINVEVPGQRVVFNSPPDEGTMYATIPFSATVLPITIATPLDYTWEATGLDTQTHADVDSRTDYASFTWLSSGTKIITVSVTGGPTLGATVLSRTHTIEVEEVNVRVNLNGPSHQEILSSGTFTATVLPPSLQTAPLTYTWEATDLDEVVHVPGTLELTDTVQLSWLIRGAKTVKVTAWNEFFSRSDTMQVNVFAVDPEDILTNFPDTAEYDQNYDWFYAATRPVSVTRPFTYTWDWSHPSEVTASKPHPFDHVIGATDELTSRNQIEFTWHPGSPPARDHALRTLTTTVASAGGGIYTETHAIQVTYRPLLRNNTGTGPIPDQAIFEDDTVTVAFTTIDTDTLGTLDHSGWSSRNWIVSGSNIVFGNDSPTQRNTTDQDNPNYNIFDSTVVITPTENQWGDVRITLASDDGILEGEIDFTLTITPVNDAPEFTLRETTYITEEDSGPQVLNRWARNISAGPNENSEQDVSFTVDGVAVEGGYDPDELFAVQPTLSHTGTLTFTPAPNAHGTAVVTVTLHDDGGMDHPEQNPQDASESRTFTIVIKPVNDEPVAASAAFTINEEETLIITETELLDLATDVDTDEDRPLWYENDALSLDAVAPAQDGTTALLTDSDGPGAPFEYIRYRPDQHFNGTDTFTYTIRDRPGETSVATITVTILPTGDPPVAADMEMTTYEDTPLVITATRVLTHATDPDDDTLTLADKPMLDATTPVTSVQNGTVDQTTSDITYTPPENFHGLDAFTYMISDGVYTDTAIITVTVLAVNDPPSFMMGTSPITMVSKSDPQPYPDGVGWATEIIAGPEDEQETQTISFTLTNDNEDLFTEQPSLDAATGDLAFTIAGDHVEGSATVTTTLRDDGGVDPEHGGDNTTSQTFLVEITPNQAPVATIATFETEFETPLDIPIADLGSDPDGDEIWFDSVSDDQEGDGTFSLSADRKTIHYEPAAGFSGEDSFTFTISDDDLSDTGEHAVVIVHERSVYYAYLPLIVKRGKADLVVSNISILPDRSQEGNVYTAGEPVTITVEIENIGTGHAPPFWADVFINPSSPPTQPNTAWYTLCTLDPCFGVTWGVPDPLPAGEKVVLTSVPGSYGYKEGNGVQIPEWEGWFVSGTSNLYAYVDSWHDNDPDNGGVLEINEENNTAHMQITVVGENPPTLSSTTPWDNTMLQFLRAPSRPLLVEE
jgi:hypothetical protein